MDQIADGMAPISGTCATHGPWTVRMPPFLARVLERSGASGCPACGAELVAAKRTEDLAQSDADLVAARRQWGETLLGRAAVPGQFRDATLSDPCATPEHLAVVQRLLLYVGSWPARLRNGASIVLHGPTGTGKSRMAAAALKAVLNQGARGTFLRQDALSAMVRACYGPQATRSEDAIMAELIGMDMLVIDEVGVGKTTEHEIRMLNSVIAGRHEEMRPTLITTNLARVDLETYLGQRLADRMKSWTWIACEWASYRDSADYAMGARAA